MASKVDSHPPKKLNLLEDSGSDDEAGGASLVPSKLGINEEYARKFEHNKKREEKQRLEEKYKTSNGIGNSSDDDDDDSGSSSDETEDEDGFLATEDLDAQISATLSAIKNKDPRVKDKSFSFFAGTSEDADEAPTAEKKTKPLYLKDYHREKILAGGVGASDDEDDDEGPPRPQTYVHEQDALKMSIISEINKAAAGDSSEVESEDGDFVKRKAPKGKKEQDESASMAAKQHLSETDVANADKDPELFLSNFMASRAWVAEDGRNWKAFESDDEDEDGQGEKAEEFEQAYNMRFEDPEKSNEVLRSYARDITAAKSVRREEATGRKRQRQLEKEKKEAEKQERREEKARLRRLKIEEAEEKLRKIKRAAGLSGRQTTDDELMKFLDEAWEDDKWEEAMRKRFDEQYYAEEDRGDDASGGSDDDVDEDGKTKKRKPKKPTWDDDIDITDIVPDFEAEEGGAKFTLSDEEENEDENEDEEDGEGSRPSKKRKTGKDHKRDRQAAKKVAKASRSRIEALVDARMDLDPDLTLSSHGAARKPRNLTNEEEETVKFRYRETSPQSFGLTARDILFAPSDASLNKFAGLKKLATFRDEEKKRKDKKRLGKKARLREWRRETFGRAFERTGPVVPDETISKRGEKSGGAEGENGERNGQGDGEEETQKKKKRKRSRGKKGKGAVEGDVEME